VQTFLPSSVVSECAEILDSKRLNKQILEAYQILKVLSGASPSGAWRNHPAALMWQGHEHALFSYANVMATEASLRGIKVDKNLFNLNELKNQYSKKWGKGLPRWTQDNHIMMRITTTHKANLFKKDPLYYIRFQYAVDSPHNSPCCPNRKEPCKYYWPTHEERKLAHV